MEEDGKRQQGWRKGTWIYQKNSVVTIFGLYDHSNHLCIQTMDELRAMMERFDLPSPGAVFDINFFRDSPECFWASCPLLLSQVRALDGRVPIAGCSTTPSPPLHIRLSTSSPSIP